MKRVYILFFKFAISLVAVVVAIALVYFPQTEGRAQGLDLVSIYRDPLIIYVYIVSITFFFILFQIFKILGLTEENKLGSAKAANVFKRIKYSAVVFIGFIILGLFYIRLFVHGDDPAGPTGLAILVMLVSAITALIANVYQKRIK